MNGDILPLAGRVVDISEATKRYYEESDCPVMVRRDALFSNVYELNSLLFPVKILELWFIQYALLLRSF